MTKFLASIKNEYEALEVRKANIDIIDLKAINDGALGFVGKNIMTNVRQLLSSHTISVTIGNDKNPNNCTTINNIKYAISSRIDYIKIGLFENKYVHEHHKLLQKIDFQNTNPICVMFADKEFNLEVAKKISSIGYKGIMIDTCNKNGISTTQLLPNHLIEEFVRQMKKRNIFCGLSGSLNFSDIKKLKSLNPDFLGFRGLVCINGNDRDEISLDLLNQVSLEIAKH
ncbi:MAG: hypothetical protein CMD88_03330 [Gammaproteobacteria bacterium]|nr:hypothetical protein [Gammaproteobacteria bacterium]|tara:strand:+ start:1750 stop:2430 length:681 start_codon:yes stop_codon:yes gene_type:complete